MEIINIKKLLTENKTINFVYLLKKRL
jgi:hypothetical protein